VLVLLILFLVLLCDITAHLVFTSLLRTFRPQI
jgi:hypothetical protein